MSDITYISCKDTAVLIRAALKENFPGVKFGVTMRPSGSSIYVKWVDGPATKAVESVVKNYEGASFDGMIDLKSTVTSTFHGKKVNFGSDYVFTSHSYTTGYLAPIVKGVCDKFGQPCWPINESFGSAWISERWDGDHEWLRSRILETIANGGQE